MGKELPMARSEEEGQSMLLAGVRLGVYGSPPSRRDKGKKKDSAAKRKARGKAKAAEEESQTSTSAEGTNAKPRQQRHRQSNRGRKPAGGDKGVDRTPRRSASELAIEHPGHYCPSGEPHYFVEDSHVDGGVMFRCKQCGKYLWQPIVLEGVTRLGWLMHKHGDTEGYQMFITNYRNAKIMVAKMQDLWYASQRIGDRGQFTKVVVEVMRQKEYDKVEGGK